MKKANETQSLPRKVFLDTQVFYSAHFNTDRDYFRRIKDLVLERTLKIISTEVTQREIRRRVELYVREKFEQKTHSRLVEKMEETGLSGEFQDLLSKIEPSSLERRLIDRVEKFFADTTCNVIPYEKTNVRDVLTWYFECKAPFSESKRHEFPDGFVISSLIGHLQADEQIAVISGDSDFKTGHKQLINFESVPAYLDHLTDELDRERYKIVRAGLDAHHNKISEAIIDHLKNCGFYEINEAESEVTDVTDFEIEVQGVDILENHDSDGAILANVFVRAVAKYVAHVHYARSDNASYDHEEKRPIYYEYINAEWPQELIVETEAEITVDRKSGDIDEINLNGETIGSDIEVTSDDEYPYK